MNFDVSCFRRLSLSPYTVRGLNWPQADGNPLTALPRSCFTVQCSQQKRRAGPDSSTAGRALTGRDPKMLQRKPEILHPPLFGETKASKELKGRLCSLALLQRRPSHVLQLTLQYTLRTGDLLH